MLVCPCGANLEAQKSPHGRRSGAVYICSAHRRKGPKVCPNDRVLSMAEIEDHVLTVFEDQVLSADMIERVLATLPKNENDRERIDADIMKLSKQVENLTTAIADGGDIPELVATLKAASRKLADTKRLRDLASEETSGDELRAALEKRIDDWRSVLRKYPAQARQVVSKLLGPIKLADYESAPGSDRKDRRGKENIEPSDIAWTAEVRIAGFLAGLPVTQLVLSFLRDR